MYLITGASRGIGLYLFREMKACGQPVLGTYRVTRPEELTDYCQVDLTSEPDVAAFVEKNKQRLGHINLIHCAGVNDNSILHKMDFDNWKKVFAGNVDSAFLLLKYLLPVMRRDCYGRIVLFSSIVPKLGVPGTAAYSSSKSALWGLMKAVAAENASRMITCNCLNLGYFSAGMIDEVPSGAKAKLLGDIPAGKFGDPCNILSAVRFLVDSDYTTGAEININGGLF